MESDLQELERRAGIRGDEDEPAPLPTRPSAAPSSSRNDDAKSESGFSAISHQTGSSRMDAKLIAERYRNKKAARSKNNL